MKAEESPGSPYKFNTAIMTDDLGTTPDICSSICHRQVKETGDECNLIVLKCIKLLINNYSSYA
jgi:hypothetical protein